MRVLFIHQAFPAQFGRLALELTDAYGWECPFLIESYSACPTPSRAMLEHLPRFPIPIAPRPPRQTPWPQVHGAWLELCQAVYHGVKNLPGPRPDLVVAHGGQGAPTLFLPDLLDCPIVNYCEYYFPARHSDLTYRVDLPPAEPAPFYPRCINAPTLMGLLACDAGYSATHFQRASFPERFRNRIEVHFDGVDTTLYRPRAIPRTIAGRAIPPGTRIVTFVARGLESMRGFDLFLDVARRILRARRDVLFVVAGSEEVYYGWDALVTGGVSFKQWAVSRAETDLSRFLFLGQVEPERLAEVLALSDLHIYLSVPFVLSWSLINAMASGCVVLGSDVPPVREVIEPGRTGLVEPLFDVDRLAETALRVLDDPAAFRPLGQAARALVEERYSLDVAVPDLKDYFERVAAAGTRREPGPRRGEVRATRDQTSA
jgi:glycosyltransferase involved in cell wall biosynthesis